MTYRHHREDAYLITKDFSHPDRDSPRLTHACRNSCFEECRIIELTSRFITYRSIITSSCYNAQPTHSGQMVRPTPVIYSIGDEVITVVGARESYDQAKHTENESLVESIFEHFIIIRSKL